MGETANDQSEGKMKVLTCFLIASFFLASCGLSKEEACRKYNKSEEKYWLCMTN